LPKASQISNTQSKPFVADATGGKPSKGSFDKQSKALTIEELLNSTGYKIPSLRRGQEVSGKILSISNDEILMDISAKAEGIIFGRELSAVRDITSKYSVGDTIEASVVYPENDAGQVVLSLRKQSGERRWNELEEKQKSQEFIEVFAIEANKGGIICEWMGVRGFLPASQLTQTPSNFSDLIGKSIKTKVIEVDRSTARLILSQKELDKKDVDEINKLLSKVIIGDKYSGVVTAVLPFGIFVEIPVGKEDREGSEGKDGKVEGLVHISEISWEKVEEPGKLFKVGEEVEVMIIAKDSVTGRLNLSIKQLTKDPFTEASEKFSKDQEVSGEVAKIISIGAIVNLEAGIEGVVPASKIPQSEDWQQGKKVKLIVDSIDMKSRRITLVPLSIVKPVLYR
jgi:ribosomal protein S1